MNEIAGGARKGQRQNLGRLLLPMASVAGSLACVGIGFSLLYHRVDWDEVGRILLTLDKAWFCAAIALYWLPQTFNSFRFQCVIRWLSPAESPTVLPLRLVFRVVCAAAFIAVVTPIGLVADAAKVGVLRLIANMSITNAARATLFDRVIAVQWMALFGLAALAYQLFRGVPLYLLSLQLSLFAGVLAGIVLLLLLPGMLDYLRIGIVSRVALMFSGYWLLLMPTRALVQASITLSGVILIWATLYCLLRATGVTADLWLVASFVPFLQIINSVPFLYLGWGGRELAMAATLGTVGGLSLNEALAVSAAWGIALIVAGAANGAFILADWKSYRRSSDATTAKPEGRAPLD